MDKMYVGIAAAVAVIVICFLLFKPEFLISGGDGNTRIMSVKPNGDLILSDNTVQDINTYMANMEKEMRDKIAAETTARKTSIEQNVAAINNRLKALEDNSLQFNKSFTLRFGWGNTCNKHVRPVGAWSHAGGGAQLGYTNIDPPGNEHGTYTFKAVKDAKHCGA